MKKSKEGMIGLTEIQEIKEDLDVLRTNVVTLAQDLKSGGSIVASESLRQLKTIGETGYHKIEDQVKDKPAQSLALAFCAGVVCSYFMSSGARH